MNPGEFLLLNLAHWAHEIDIFRSWALLDPGTFRRVQRADWRKLPYWVFIPMGLLFTGSIALISYHPSVSPSWAIWGSLACQLASHVLTGAMWGPWQAKLSQDERGASSPYLAKILSTHWIRTFLINANGAIMLAWGIRAFA